MHVFAQGVSRSFPNLPPADFNLKVKLLGPRRADSIRDAVNAGYLDGYICNGELWVRRGDLHDLAPAGRCTYDPQDDSYIAPEILD